VNKGLDLNRLLAELLSLNSLGLLRRELLRLLRDELLRLNRLRLLRGELLLDLEWLLQESRLLLWLYLAGPDSLLESEL